MTCTSSSSAKDGEVALLVFAAKGAIAGRPLVEKKKKLFEYI